MFYYTQDNILTNEQCNQLIQRSNELGFNPSKVQYYGTEVSMNSVRNNYRLELPDYELAKQLQSLLVNKLASHFPQKFKGKKFVELNNHFRVYAYNPGEYFKPHKDGRITLENMESLVTVLFYLNDSTGGGETVLMPNGYAHKESHIIITPKKGSVLMFDHDVFHEGRLVTHGNKYVLRSDLFFEK